MKTVCVECQKEYRVKKAGIYLLETAGQEQRPYKLWMADLLYCPTCGHEIVARLADNPLARDHQEETMKQRLEEARQSGWLYYDHEFLI